MKNKTALLVMLLVTSYIWVPLITGLLLGVIGATIMVFGIIPTEIVKIIGRM